MKLPIARCALLLCLLSPLRRPVDAAETEAGVELALTNGVKELRLPLVSGVDEFRVMRSSSVMAPFLETPTGVISGYSWRENGILSGPGAEFFRVAMMPKPAADILAAGVLNRLAYGPTPDELQRVKQIGADAFIQEQLAPEKISETLAIDQIDTRSEWEHVVVTGTASSDTLYIYMTGKGDCYIDDIQIVRGRVAESGANAVRNGDFENGLSGWTVSPNLVESTVVTDVKHSGMAALHVVSADRGSSRASSIYRADLGLANDQPYTLSYWFKRGSSRSTSLVLRLSGSGIYSSPGTLGTRLALGVATLNNLATWHILHAIQSRKQLLEVLLQFFENHFVTQQSKSREYLDRYYDGEETDQMATNLEYQELSRWREALLNPQCTFHDLLKISAESPAMIIYLDTINSKGNGSNIANENYARELLELFTFGVDNGYDQNDITVMSRAWTGWTMRLVDPENVNDPFAAQSTTRRVGATNDAIASLEGVWSFAYQPGNHDLSKKVIFPGKTVPTRFGAPYAGRDYQLVLEPSFADSGWQYYTATGQAKSSTLYIYMEGEGDCYLDDVVMVEGRVAGAGANHVNNGGFESGLSGWSVASNLSGSRAVSDVVHSGSSALHLVSTREGTSSSTAIVRRDLNLVSNQTYTVSYWFKPGTNMTGPLRIRLSGQGVTSSASPTNTIQEGYTILTHLADQPFTQEYLSVKLCRLFVHEDFATGYDFTDPNLSAEGRLVRDCMRAWEENVPKGQIRKVLEVIFNSALFRSQAAVAQKVKTPLEFTVSAVRALRAEVSGVWTADSDGDSIRAAINRMGRMRLFDRDTPDGYPEAAAPWISAGTLTERLRFVQALLLPIASGRPEDAGGSVADPVKLLKAKLPQEAWRDSDAVARYFTEILFPTEGKANLDEYRAQARTYLNTADNGVTASEFSSLSESAYDLRVRGMVAMLMTFQRFQEQ